MVLTSSMRARPPSLLGSSMARRMVASTSGGKVPSPVTSRRVTSVAVARWEVGEVVARLADFWSPRWVGRLREGDGRSCLGERRSRGSRRSP